MANFIIFRCPLCRRGLEISGVGEAISYFNCPEHGERTLKDVKTTLSRQENIHKMTGVVYELSLPIQRSF